MVHAVGPVGGRAVGLGTGKGARTAGQAAAGGRRRGSGDPSPGETHRMVPVVSQQAAPGGPA